MMKKIALIALGLSVLFLFTSCDSDDNNTEKHESKSIEKLQFIDEYVIPDNTMFQNTLVGGISGIDYANGTWYLISDDSKSPTRFFTANIDYDLNGFSNITINGVKELKDKTGDSFTEGDVDPESIRVTDNGNIVWSSEGNINGNIDPFVRFADSEGKYISETIIDSKFKISTNSELGPRHNGAFEGLSISNDGYWVTMELPLKQDGEAPTISNTESPIRVAHINNDGTFGKEFAYELDAVSRQSSNTAFTVNGVVEILEYNTNHFLFLERSYSTGFTDGGNNVKVYKVDISNATDISSIDSLIDATYTKATKELLFDLETIRTELTDGVVDNIEGITFGPDLENGNRSIMLVADNNFSAFGPQLNQFILLEVEN